MLIMMTIMMKVKLGSSSSSRRDGRKVEEKDQDAEKVVKEMEGKWAFVEKGSRW
jgi:hypothetical protein